MSSGINGNTNLKEITTMNLYALLIGINDYPTRPLQQCVKDTGKIETYLNSIKSQFGNTYIKKILNKDATRKNIIDSINTFFTSATDEDVALIYYSGHGAQEESAGYFPDEQDGLLECMVCYSTGAITSAQFLADKELRYLLYKLNTNPHLITIFDACHSGDIVRAFHQEEDFESRPKRVAGAFEARPYASFVFAGDSEVEKIQPDGSRKIFIPFKNHIHLAACLSEQTSWEDGKGGVFTRYLTELLKTTNSELTYLDIARWAKISLKTVTDKNQTPLVTLQGEGKLNVNSPWLNLKPKRKSFWEGTVTANSTGQWVYSRGSLLGVKEGMSVIITLDNKEEEKVIVKEVESDQSFLDVPINIAGKLGNDKKVFAARTEITTYAGLKLFINDIDDDPEISKTISSLLSQIEKVSIVPDHNADFFINVFNGTIYFSLPEHEFQPLSEQIIISNNKDVEAKLKDQLKYFIKWQHFYSLDNPGKDFEKSPIQVSVISESGGAIDVTNGVYRLEPNSTRLQSGELYKALSMKITNISQENLFVGVLTLGSDLSITSKPFNGIVINLPAGASKTLYDHTQKKQVFATLDKYKEVYNWKEEWFYYKFIFNNFEDFTPSLNSKDFLQPPVDPPRTLPVLKDLRITKGEGGEVEEVKKKWGTCRTRIELANSTYNMVTGDLLEYAEEYSKSTLLSPFIRSLYFEEEFNGKTFELNLKQNKDQTAAEVRATHNLIVKLFNYIYKSARRKSFERQKHSTGPIVVAEGDSWFLYPKPGVKDTLDYIMNEYRLLSLAEAGDEVADYIRNDELLKAVKKQLPAFVLISGGGNDILGPEIKDILKKNVAHGQSATDFLDVQKFNDKLKLLSDGYQMFFKEIIKLVPNVLILVHGYDYVRSNPDEKTIKHGWANRYMIEEGIQGPELRKLIIRFLVDNFNAMLQEFENNYAPNVRYVNNRGTVPENEWMDEIHPNNTGFQKVANNFLAIMQHQ